MFFKYLTLFSLGTGALLRKIFGPKREEVTGERGNLHELYNCTLHWILLEGWNQRGWDERDMTHVTCVGEKRNAYKILAENSVTKYLTGRPGLLGENVWESRGFKMHYFLAHMYQCLTFLTAHSSADQIMFTWRKCHYQKPSKCSLHEANKMNAKCNFRTNNPGRIRGNFILGF
jgi:hypothetical protein